MTDKNNNLPVTDKRWDAEYAVTAELLAKRREARRAADRRRILRQKLCAAAFLAAAVLTAALAFRPQKNDPPKTDKPAVSANTSASSETESVAERGITITYDLDYTTETLGGETLEALMTTDENGTKRADEEKCREYIDRLADKYDTCDLPRKFHATLQGDIIVPPSDDAKYGWKTDREKTCAELVDMLNKGETAESVKPVYYDDGYGYVFTGVPSARTAEGDIGDSYVEIDLSAQRLWVYRGGEEVYACDIVSGETTSMTKTTLPGVYKLWYKARNYRMTGSNADGESWDAVCEYWNRVAICGIGLHDARSRSAFGGDIYKYDGSQGCINMPFEGAKYIYEQVDMGTPVVMYYSEEDNRRLGFTK